jgi:hypothetical protein
MSVHLDLPDGQWAELREGGVGKAPERLRRPLRLAEHALNRVNPRLSVPAPDETPSEPTEPVNEEMQAAFGASLAKLVDFPAELVEEPGAVETIWIPTDDQEIASTAYNDALVGCMVEKWSFGPVSVEAAGDLPGDAYDAIVIRIREMAVEAAQAMTQEDDLVPS